MILAGPCKPCGAMVRGLFEGPVTLLDFCPEKVLQGQTLAALGLGLYCNTCNIYFNNIIYTREITVTCIILRVLRMYIFYNIKLKKSVTRCYKRFSYQLFPFSDCIRGFALFWISQLFAVFGRRLVCLYEFSSLVYWATVGKKFGAGH